MSAYRSAGSWYDTEVFGFSTKLFTDTQIAAARAATLDSFFGTLVTGWTSTLTQEMTDRLLPWKLSMGHLYVLKINLIIDD